MSKKKIREQVALMLREQAELQQRQSQQLRPYTPTESPIAPRRSGFFGGIFESWGLDHEIDIGQKRLSILRMEGEAHRMGMEFAYETQIAPYRFDSERRILAANAVKAEGDARITISKAIESEANASMTLMELKRAKKALKE